MNIDYENRRLYKLCKDNREASKKLGADCARKLQARLSDIEAAANVNELPAGNPHPLHHNKKGQLSISLAGGQRLILKPDHQPVPLKKDGGINWAAVTNITILYIGDYHD